MKIYRNYTRAAAGAAEGSRKISGTPITFGKRSELLYDPDHGACYEVIERGAVSPDLLKGDIVACINHDPGQMLARSTDGKGSLRLTLGDDGVRMEFDAPSTCYGDVAYEGCKRGDFQGMSFGFVCDPEEDLSYTKDTDDDGTPIWVRHVNRIRRLFDVSIVTYPAYPDTDVEARGKLSEEGRSKLSEEGRVKRKECDAAMLRDFDEIMRFLRNR